MEQESLNVEAAIIAATLVFLILAAFIVMILLVYRRRRDLLIIENIQLKATFKQELLKTQIEVQEQTLGHISQEIHDNITQVLSFVKLDLARTDGLDERSRREKIKNNRELIAQTINDLRDLSKSLSYEHIKEIGLAMSIRVEADRVNKSGLINCEMIVDGEAYDLGKETELVLFRIFQESLNNTLKHAGSKHFKIGLQYYQQLFTLTLEDDGSGFSAEAIADKAGSGLKNMKNRAALIGGQLTINSSVGKGCSIVVALNPLKLLDTDGTHSDSPG